MLVICYNSSIVGTGGCVEPQNDVLVQQGHAFQLITLQQLLESSLFLAENKTI